MKAPPTKPTLVNSILASQPVYMILGAAGLLIGGVVVSHIPDEYKAVLSVVVGGIATKLTQASVAPAATLSAVAAKASADTAKVLDGAPPGELHADSIPLVQSVTRAAVESVGGLAGKTATTVVENATNSVIEGVTSRLTRRFRK